MQGCWCKQSYSLWHLQIQWWWVKTPYTERARTRILEIARLKQARAVHQISTYSSIRFVAMGRWPSSRATQHLSRGTMGHASISVLLSVYFLYFPWTSVRFGSKTGQCWATIGFVNVSLCLSFGILRRLFTFDGPQNPRSSFQNTCKDKRCPLPSSTVTKSNFPGGVLDDRGVIFSAGQVQINKRAKCW